MKILVTNIPVDAYIEAWVEIPDDTAEDDIQGAIGKSIIQNGVVSNPNSMPANEEASIGDINEDLITSGWEFSFER
jgi:hypothetical protein